MNTEKFKDLLADFGRYCLINHISCKKVIDFLNKDYEDLIDLRNKLQYEIEDEEIYEEDIHTLDHALDYLELLLGILNLQKEDMQDDGLYYKLGIELLDKETQQPIEHIEYEEFDNLKQAKELYDSWNTIDRETAKYIYECTSDDEILLDCQGYKEDNTIGSTSFGTKGE